jgi:YegS/Rv2252/BmrU family lipid kinase
MRKAALLYNPDSGGSRKRRQRELESVVAMLRTTGVDASVVLTNSSAHAEEQARQAVAAGCDTVFACGGDGTIHSIVQALAGSSVGLAILPMGTANALAHDLGLPMTLAAAAQMAVNGARRRIALGHIKYFDRSGNPGTRFFVVAAGVGVDAHLFYKLNPDVKQRLGMAAYYGKAWHLWWTYPMVRFVAEYVETGSAEPKKVSLTELLGVRIRHFGGVLQELAPGASLDRDDLRLILCHTASRLAYLSYVTRALLRLRPTVPGIELAHVAKVRCRYPEPSSSGGVPETQSRVYVEADGELLGTLPAEISVLPDALTLLAPSR